MLLIFSSRVFQNSSAALGMKHWRMSPYHPQVNITELANRNKMSMLIAHTGRHHDLDAKLPDLAFATRTTANRSTGFTPACLTFGKELSFPLENTCTTNNRSAARSYGQFAGSLRRRPRETSFVMAGRLWTSHGRLSSAIAATGTCN